MVTCLRQRIGGENDSICRSRGHGSCAAAVRARRPRAGLAGQAGEIHRSLSARRLGRPARAHAGCEARRVARAAIRRRKQARRFGLDRHGFRREEPARRVHLRVRVRHARDEPVADSQPPYDTLHDLEPVMLVGTAPMAIVTSPAKPYKTFGDVVAAAKAKPETLAIGSVGNGSLGHLAMIVVQQTGGFKVTHVPYKGGGPMMADVMGGQIDLGIASVAALS